MLAWLESFIKSVVQVPDAVELQESQGTLTRVITVTVADDDYSLFRGRNNRLLRALNTTAGLAGAKDRVRYVVKLA